MVSPVDPEVVYVYGEQGFWRFEAAGKADGAITALAGAGGLPAGGVRDRVYLGPDGQTLIVGAAKQGIYRSADAGARWARSMPTPTSASCTSTPGIPSG